MSSSITQFSYYHASIAKMSAHLNVTKVMGKLWGGEELEKIEIYKGTTLKTAYRPIHEGKWQARLTNSSPCYISLVSVCSLT